MDYQIEQVYNIYQRVTGVLSGKPFKYRKNFDDFAKSEPEKYSALIKIIKILNDLPGVNINKYFEAPYKVFPNEFSGVIIKLDFYCKPRAIRAYTDYIMSQSKVDENLMTEDARNKVLFGLKHIIEVCNKLECSYMCYLASQDSIPMFIDDLNHGLINKWVLAGFRLDGHDFSGCVNFDMFPEAEFMFGTCNINECLDDMLAVLTAREIRWLQAVVQRAKNNYLNNKTT